MTKTKNDRLTKTNIQVDPQTERDTVRDIATLSLLGGASLCDFIRKADAS